MKRISKILLSVLLLASMISGMLPMSIFSSAAVEKTVSAWTDLKNAITSAANGDVIVISGIIECGTLSGTAVTLCEFTASKNKTLKSKTSSVFTLKRPRWHYGLQSDVSSSANYNSCRRPLFTIASGGTLNLENITVTGGGTLNLYSGSVISDGYSASHGGALTNQGTVNIYDVGEKRGNLHFFGKYNLHLFRLRSKFE